MVYAAQEVAGGATVAMKVLHPEMVGTTGRKRFLQEIDFARRLSHPGIVPLLDSGEAAGTLYYVMPLVAGASLQHRLKRERQLPVPEAVRIAGEVAEALAYAHAQGIVHRDVKPANILLGPERAIVADFGVARALLRSSSVESISSSGVQVGTVEYMAPEQAAGDSEIDGRADLYSLGCVLYEMLAGGPPFVGLNAQSTLARHAMDPVPPLRTVRPSVPKSVEEVVYQALAKAPADRFRDTRAFAAALKQVSDDPLVRVVDGGASRRRRLTMAAAAAVLAVGGLWWARRVAVAAEAGRVAAADTTRVVIFPVEGAASAGEAARLDEGMRRAFVRWKGLQAVDPSALRERLPASGPPGASQSRDIALAERARRWVQSSVTSSARDTRLRVTLHDASAPGSALAEVDGLLPDSGAARDSVLDGLAERLLVRSEVPAASRSAGSGTASLPARQAYVAGLVAFDAWQLARADSQFSAALRFDPEFAAASLGVALTRHWTNQRTPLWTPAANAANAGRARLTAREREQVDALQDVVARRHPEACARWEALTRADTLDFAAWYGAAHCLARDNLVLRDARSPSGWRFRTSYRAALERYRRAFSLHPAVLQALRDNAFEPVRRLLKTSVSDVRSGAAAPPDTGVFVAFATLLNDTLAFVPFPAAAFEASDPRALSRMPATVGQALKRQREFFRDLAISWAAAVPQGLEAREAIAWSLLIIGDRAAVDSIVSARRLARSTPESLRVMATEAWMRAQVAIPDDRAGVRRSRAVADSVLRHPRAAEVEPQVLAGIAALTGRGSRAAGAVRAMTTAVIGGVPPALAADATVLRVYAAIGGPVDSLRVLEGRVDSLIAALVPAAEQEAVRQRAMARAASLAFAVRPFASAELLGRSGDYLLGAQAAWLRRDTAQVREVMSRLRASRSQFGPADLTLDALLPEAELLCAASGPAAAAAWLEPTLAALRLRATAIDAVHAASMVRAVRLRGDLALALGDTASATRWRAPSQILWADADAALARPLSTPALCVR
ncbi:MAG: protein kinase [Gemmatimonadetes bacterium]|nr:protein kinase [Gemmatimonadota bacterium]